MSSVDAVRRFNRFYTRRIGALQRRPTSAARTRCREARVLYELGQRGDCTASELGAELDLDAGLSQPPAAGPRSAAAWCRRERSAQDDARRGCSRSPPKGRKAFALLDERSRDEVAAMLRRCAAPDRDAPGARRCTPCNRS